jgi:hypothetical protein
LANRGLSAFAWPGEVCVIRVPLVFIRRGWAPTQIEPFDALR